MKKNAIFLRVAIIIIASLLFACSQKKVEPTISVFDELNAPKPSELVKVAEVWDPLVLRLSEDGFSDSEISFFFAQLGDTHSQDPMGRKIKELYGYTFKPKKTTPSVTAPKPVTTVYKDVITSSSVAQCKDFLNTYADAFTYSEQVYGVPKEVAVALLFVETRLGNFLGKENPLYVLASMALSDQPEYIESWLPSFPEIEKKPEWIFERMNDKSNWAYNELRSLLKYSLENELNPIEMKGSMYGAIGLCQFMPSNIPHYAADGNGDGVIDLFSPPDAIASLSNYLVKHGWSNQSRELQHKTLKRYNNLNIYANTILSLASKVATS